MSVRRFARFIALEAAALALPFPRADGAPLRHGARYLPHVPRQNDALPPGSHIGERYTVGRVLGSGSMGTVYEARDERDPSGACVAVKTLLSPGAKGDAAERRARFLREAAVCATIRHPHVVPVIDHGIDSATDVPYLVMPLLAGEDLASLLDRVGWLEPSVAVPLVVQACDGLGAVHARGIVHRDVKPSNLFLETAPTGNVVVKVTDFGLAKAYDAPDASGRALAGLTATGRFMGTPQYFSPEQAISAKHVDVRSDVFSIAMSLYHALCGAPAFAYVRSFMGLVLELTGREAPHLQDAAPWVPPEITRIVHAALLRDPSARCPSVAELALALDMALGIDASRRPVPWAALRAMPPMTPHKTDTARLAASPHAELATSWDELLHT
jgi:serine/threonine-protein kinase